MKGKGKGERGDVKEKGVAFTPLSYIQIASSCPTLYSAKSRQSSLNVQELDGLQTDLEGMLSSVAMRMKQLKEELDSLQSPEARSPAPKQHSKGKDIKGKVVNEAVNQKRQPSKSHEEKPTKKQKLEESAGAGSVSASKRASSSKADKTEPTKKSKDTPTKATPGRPPKAKNIAIESTVLPLAEAASPTAPQTAKSQTPARPAKNDAPNRFWTLVEPYCSDITSEDLKVLEDIMRSHVDDVDYHKIPPLGKHYAEKWAHEDLLEEQRQSSKLQDKRRSSSSTCSSEASDLTKKSHDSSSNDVDASYGPLTQRLVQALIEENIMAPLTDTCISEADAAEAASISPRSLAKQLNMGILEREAGSEDEESADEVLAELKKKQAELKAIGQQNMSVTKRLYKMAKDEMLRQDTRKRIIVADADVMEAYRKMQQTRQKKKSATKKEVDAVKRALRERDLLVKQLENN